VVTGTGAAYLYFSTASGSPTEQKLTDVLVGTPNDDFVTGAVYAYYGSATGAGEEQRLTASLRKGKSQFGYAVSPAGDVDADGSADVLVGAPTAYGGYGFVYLGVCRDDDADGACVADDCDDGDATVATGLPEICDDGADTDCDGLADGEDPACAAPLDDQGGGCSHTPGVAPLAGVALVALGVSRRRRR
jgi:uncharacterized protein (TIGR03382 family)